MLNQPVVSIIVPTRNSGQTLAACLDSVKAQTYPHIELIVVDRDSTDDTKTIARQYTSQVYNHGPERSAQVNFGVTKAKGEYVYKIDSDFVLDPEVVAQCIAKAADGFDAVVVHNSPDTRVSWIAKVRKFEVDMFKYDLLHSSARFVRKEVYQAIGGFNPNITAGEDYDFQNKLNRGSYRTGFIDAEALHLGEPTSFWRYMLKSYDYGKDSATYRKDNPAEFNSQLKFVLLVWFKHWRRFVRHPILGAGLFMFYVVKFTFAGTGLIIAQLSKEKERNHGAN
jgi:glycosyltransferase involved in cell wall biosynthesis